MSNCGRDEASPPSEIWLATQEQVDALEGCQRLDTLQLSIQPAEDVALDLRTLAALREVTGQVTIGCPSNGEHCSHRKSEVTLTGLEQLAAAGGLALGGLPATSLAPLGNVVLAPRPTATLISLGTINHGFLLIDSCDGLEDLTGLGQTETALGVTLSNNANLTSLAGLSLSATGSSLVISDSPALVDLDSVGHASSLLGLILALLRGVDPGVAGQWSPAGCS